MTDLPPDHPLLGRIVVDSAIDPAGWAANRPYTIGASDAAKFAKASSRDLYLHNKLTEQPGSFQGSQFTRNGYDHEAGLMGYAGLVHNTATFHHPEFPEFTATPDGRSITPAGLVVLGEGKIKHKIVNGPTPREIRQVWWAQYIAGSEITKWVWQVIDPNTNRPYGEPQMIRILFDPEGFAPMLEIAHYVRRGMIAAREFERNTP